MAISKEPPRVTAVMGTGRSGTSLVTKILGLLGVDLGPEELFLAPTQNNPKGYYELKPIVKLNNEILAVMGGNCWVPPVLGPGWEASSRLARQRRLVKLLIETMFGPSSCWAFKDPRTCWVLPFWEQFLPPLHIILTLRNPLDVAASLQKADGLSFDEAIDYWHRSLTAALGHSLGKRRLFVFYEDLMEDGEGELMRIARFLDREDQAKRPEVREGLNAFVERALHRNRSSLKAVIEDPRLSFEKKALHLALRAYVPKARSEDEPSSGLERAISSPARVKGTPGVSIIIPVFNRAAMTRACLDALWENTHALADHELIVVDNGSSDATPRLLKDYERSKDNHRVITLDRNRGFSHACNQGARAAEGTYLLFLNNDTRVRRGWLDPLIRVLDHDPRVAAVGSKLVYPDGRIQNAGVVAVEDRATPDPLVAMPLYCGKAGDCPEANQARTYPALTAACLMVRRVCFHKVGGFDEGYWNGYEDVDLGFKLREAGWLLVYQPESEVVHHESQSGPERYQRVQANMGRLHQKWLGKVRPDLVIDPAGMVRSTDACRVKTYRAPTPG